jgi:sugar O-acyltransferase (sialic acid O-acetyltransferase NeuD family)
LIVGAGGHAAACIDVIEMEGRYRVAGVVGLAGEVGGSVIGYEVVGTDLDIAKLRADCRSAVVAVGQISSADARVRLFDLLIASGFELATIVSPRAYVSRHARLGAGTIVMHGAIVNARAHVGRNCIVNTLALVEHDSTVADHCHVATHAVLNSGVRLGARSFIGSGATVRQGIAIGERCVIGMGHRVLADCPDGTVMARLKS